MVGDRHFWGRRSSLDGIRHLCAPAESIPIFLRTLRSDNFRKARALAAHAFYDLAENAEYRSQIQGLLPQLVLSLSDTSPEVREQIVERFTLLEESGPDA